MCLILQFIQNCQVRKIHLQPELNSHFHLIQYFYFKTVVIKMIGSQDHMKIQLEGISGRQKQDLMRAGQVAQSFVQSSFENLQGQKQHRLLEQPTPLPHFPHGEKVFPSTQSQWISLVQSSALCLLSFPSTSLQEAGSTFFITFAILKLLFGLPSSSPD